MFVVYSVATTVAKKTYKSAAAALAFAEKLNAKAGEIVFATASVEFYNANVVKMVERVNLLSGKTFMEPSNTPYYCSPSSETYWST